MASENEASCESDPNFAVICCFLEKFGETCGLSNIDFLDLQEMLENTQEVPQDLIELHIKLLRKAKKSVSNERWERALIKMCHSYSSQDAWELERFGYKKSRISVKLRTLKHLLEMQFDLNQKFKNEVNKMSAEELRTQPLGRDRLGNAYWCQCDEACQIRVYKEDPDEETWTLVAKSREGLVSLISQLNSGDSAKSSSEPVSNEDSNSVEVEKPILDTGQTQDSSNSSVTPPKQSPEGVAEVNDDKDLEIPNQTPEAEVQGVEESDTQEKANPDEEEKPEEVVENELAEIKSKESVDTEQKPDSQGDADADADDDTPDDAIVEAEETPDDATGEGEEESNEMSEDSKSSDQSAVNNNTPEVADNALNLSAKNNQSVDLALNYKNNNDAQFDYDSDSKTGLDLSFKPKPAPTLRLKPLQELLGQSKLSSREPEKREFIGIKGKYIRGDPSGEKISLSFASHSSSTLHRKAVQSASFDAISYKRSIEEEDYEEQPMKRSRFDRPTLLGSKKFVPLYDEGEVEDEIEEPLMLVQGESSGYENECSNNSRYDESPVIGEEIEEPTLYVFGEGSGADCQTGNEKVNESDVPQSTNSDKAELKLNLNKDLPGTSGSVLDSKCSIMSPSKSQYKLGTILDTKTDKSTARTPLKKSRWDIIPVNLNLNDAETEASKNKNEKAVEEISTSKVKELVDKFENLSESPVNAKMKTLIDNNSSELSDSPALENQSDKSITKKAVFFFGNSSNVQIGAGTQSASLNFGASNYLKTSDSDTNISETENSQNENVNPVNTNEVPENLNETTPESALNSVDKCDSNIESKEDAIEEVTNCDSVLADDVNKDSKIHECDLSFVSSVNTKDSGDNNLGKETGRDEIFVTPSDQIENNDDQVNQSNEEIAANLVDLKDETVTETAAENTNSQSQVDICQNKTDTNNSAGVSESLTTKHLNESHDSQQNPETERDVSQEYSQSERNKIPSEAAEVNLNENINVDEPVQDFSTNEKTVNEVNSPETLDSKSSDVLETTNSADSASMKQDDTEDEAEIFKLESASDLSEGKKENPSPSEEIEAVGDLNERKKESVPPAEEIEAVGLTEDEKLECEENKQSEVSESLTKEFPDVSSDDNTCNSIISSSTNCQESIEAADNDDADVGETTSQERELDSSKHEIESPPKIREEQINKEPRVEKESENIRELEENMLLTNVKNYEETQEKTGTDDVMPQEGEQEDDDDDEENTASLTTLELSQSDDDTQDLPNSDETKDVLQESEVKATTPIALEVSEAEDAISIASEKPIQDDVAQDLPERVDNENTGGEDTESVCTKLIVEVPESKQIEEKSDSLEASKNEEKTEKNVAKTTDEQVNLKDKVTEPTSNLLKAALLEKPEKSSQAKLNSIENDLQSETSSLKSHEFEVKDASNNNESHANAPSECSDNNKLDCQLIVAENKMPSISATDKVKELNEVSEINENTKADSSKNVTVESATVKENDKVLSNSAVKDESQTSLELNSSLDKNVEKSSGKEAEEKSKSENEPESVNNKAEEKSKSENEPESMNNKEALKNANSKQISKDEDKNPAENKNNTDLKVNDNEKQLTDDDNKTDVVNTSSNNFVQKTNPSPHLVNEILLDTTNPTSLEENITQDQEALPKVPKKRGRKPKHLMLEKKVFVEKRELRSKLKGDQQNAEADKGKTVASSSSATQNKKLETVKGTDIDQLKEKVKRGRKPLSLKTTKRVAVTIIPKIKAKNLVPPSSQKKILKKIKTKEQAPKLGRPRKSATEKSVAAQASSPGEKRNLKPGLITKVMKKVPKAPINVKLGRRRRKKELVEKTDEVAKKRGPKRKKIELTNKIETAGIKKRSELVVKLKRAELGKKAVANLKNISEESESLNLTVSLERCELPVADKYLLHNKERMMSLRKRKPRPLGVVKAKKSKDILKKKVEDLRSANTETAQINNKNIKTMPATNTPEKSLGKIEENKQDLILHNKIENTDNSKSQKPCKSIAGIPRRRSGRRKTITDTEVDSCIESSQTQEMTKVETSVKENENKANKVPGTHDKQENKEPNNIIVNNEMKSLDCEKTGSSVESEGLLNRFKLSTQDQNKSNIIKFPLVEEVSNGEELSNEDPLAINTAEETTDKITTGEDMETIDLTSESEGVSTNTPQDLFQEKLTDCKQGVMIKGVLIKGDVTIKVKERIPVEEPPCIKKTVPLLTCINIEKLKEPNTQSFPGFDVSSPPISEESLGADNNSDVVIIEDDPLADIAPMELVPAPLTLSSFKLDSTEPLITVSTRALRKRTRCEQPEQIMEENGGKKRKTKGKRLLDLELRKSIEEQKRLQVSSSEEDIEGQPKKKESFFKSKNRKNMLAESPDYVNLDSPDAITLDSPTTIVVDSPTASSDATTKRESPVIIKKRAPPKKRKKTLMGLDIPSPSVMDLQNSMECTVRQSRRIAQLKIREEAERRKLEEMAMNEAKVEKKYKSKKSEDKDYKAEKRKKNKIIIIDEDIAVDVPEVEEKKKKRKRKHKDPRKIFDESNPWRSSSDSSSSNEEDEEEEIAEYSEAESPLFKSDHEFSPESDLEESGDVQPPKRARTARKEDDVEEDLDDHACQKCGKQDHPEWILLCDNCDNGWHCSCLRPALLIIPEGDWFCPPCQHLTLIKNLEKRLVDYDKKLTKRNIEVRRKQRLAYVGITLANVLPVKEPSKQKHTKKARNEEDEESESDETESDSESSSDSESDEPIYQLRQRRQAHSYRFNDYDELINSAIQDEVEAKGGGIGNQGRGKDIATIVQAEKEEAAAAAAQNQEQQQLESLPPVVPVEGKELSQVLLPPQQENDSDTEKIKPVKKLIGRKKPRKLNCLDVSSGDDAYSDEDFKGSSSAEEEDEYDEDLGSESSEDYGRRRGSGGVRRSTRARTSRYDKEFINDDSDDDDIPRRKRIKSIWDDSESEESDNSWRSRRKRKGGSKRHLTSSKKKSSKKSKKHLSDSDSDAFKKKKKKPKIKYGGLDDDEDVGRRTRGKRINYLDALASDSEEEVKKRGPPRIESDEEYNANEEQDVQDDDEEDEVEEEKDSDENERRAVNNVEQPLVSSVPNAPELQANTNAKLQEEIAAAVAVPETVQTLPPEEGKSTFEDQDNEDEESELNPIDEINKNLEQMNEKEMEMLMEEEEYANKQLQLMAMQLEREKKRKEREAKKLEKVEVQETKTPKKRGRKPKGSDLNNALPIATLQVGPDMQTNSELSEPPGITIPIFSDTGITTPENTPKKRRGRGKGKKTLEKEAAAAAAATTTTTTATTYSANSSSSDHIPTTIDNIPSSSNSPSSNTSMHAAQLTIASAPQPFSQSQPTPSVITRMLQSQPSQGNFHLGTGMGGHKYYAGEPQVPPHSDSPSTTAPPPQGQYIHSGPRVLAPSYRQPLQNLNTYPITRGNPAPAHRLRTPAPQGLPPMYHSHHPLDPSPSGGGPINVPVGPMNMTTAPPGPLSAATERNSPGVAPPTSDSPLSNKSDQTPPPPPYTRPPQMSRFPQGNSSPLMSPSSARHSHLITPQHVQQPRTSMPYHPGMPPNYYSSYMHPNMAAEESLPPPSYQYSEQFSEGSSPQDNCKSYEEENSGEFGGLVSYFSSQREDDLDT